MRLSAVGVFWCSSPSGAIRLRRAPGSLRPFRASRGIPHCLVFHLGVKFTADKDAEGGNLNLGHEADDRVLPTICFVVAAKASRHTTRTWPPRSPRPLLRVRCPGDPTLFCRRLARAEAVDQSQEQADGGQRAKRRMKARVRTLYQSQNVTMAAMQIAEKKVWAHRS